MSLRRNISIYGHSRILTINEKRTGFDYFYLNLRIYNLCADSVGDTKLYVYQVVLLVSPLVAIIIAFTSR